MSDDRDEKKGRGRKRGENPLGANVLYAATPEALRKAAAAGQKGDPRRPPAESERAASQAPDAAPKPKPKPEPQPALEPAETLIDLMARAQIAWLGSGVRYWGEMAELFGRRGANIASLARLSDADLDERDKLRLLDEARGYLREVGEISMREAQALSDDMAKLEHELRRTQGRPPAPTSKRHGRPTR